MKPLRVDSYDDQQRDFCHSWAESLQREVEQHRAKIAKWEGSPSESAEGMRRHIVPRWREELIDLESQLDLVSRGLDPKKPRRFLGRVQLEVRCKPRGHDLARVYPTARRSIFVPTVRSLPLGREARDKEVRARRRRRPRRILFMPNEPRDSDKYAGFVAVVDPRDPWIESYLDTDVPEGDEPREHFLIRGMTVLMPDFDAWISTHINPVTPAGRSIDLEVPADYPSRAAHELLCRCGARWLRVEALYQAIADGSSEVTV